MRGGGCGRTRIRCPRGIGGAIKAVGDADFVANGWQII